MQPSLWDRLRDDLPGLVAETDALAAGLAQALGADRVQALASGGARAIEREPGLDAPSRKQLMQLADGLARRRRLEERGIVVTADVLREAVRRDIEALFNIERLEARFLLTEREQAHQDSPGDLLADFPEIRASVVNFGVPAFAGHTGSDFDNEALARELRTLLQVFEPRLRRDSVRVQVRTGQKTGLRVDIDGVLMVAPVPERLRLSTTIDLDNGQALTTVEVL
ncbi:type VI secretion system baseplate subunit TssE [Rhodovulum euryhalinum]|uniref:type VI secretion system baseplate subunit TssE n=1 Tax=Rhodovulum euryhalinum TaxID=35805 RepID=UPI001FB34C18|nr:type VI secretion system baseplate subunit TssE [Rhodovulum euryhalinum]